MSTGPVSVGFFSDSSARPMASMPSMKRYVSLMNSEVISKMSRMRRVCSWIAVKRRSSFGLSFIWSTVSFETLEGTRYQFRRSSKYFRRWSSKGASRHALTTSVVSPRS